MGSGLVLSGVWTGVCRCWLCWSVHGSLHSDSGLGWRAGPGAAPVSLGSASSSPPSMQTGGNSRDFRISASSRLAEPGWERAGVGALRREAREGSHLPSSIPASLHPRPWAAAFSLILSSAPHLYCRAPSVCPLPRPLAEPPASEALRVEAPSMSARGGAPHQQGAVWAWLSYRHRKEDSLGCGRGRA